MMHGGGGHWGGIGMRGRLSSVDMDEEYVGRFYDHKVVQRLVGYIMPYKLLFALGWVTMLVYTITSVVSPWLVGYAIDHYIVRGDFGGLTFIFVVYLLTAVVNTVANYGQLVIMASVGQRVLYNLRMEMFEHLQRLSLGFYDRNEVGRIMSRVQNDVQELQEFLTSGVLSLGDVLVLVGILVVLFLMNPFLAAVALAVLPLLFAFLAFWQGRAQKTFLRVRQAIAAVNAGLQENISGVRVIQSLVREQENLRRFDAVNESHFGANVQAGRLSSIMLPAVEVLVALSTALVVIFGGRQVLSGGLQIGVVIAFALYVQRFFEPVRTLIMQYTQFQRSMTAGLRIFQVLDTKPEIVDAPDAVELPPAKGHIRFERVNFSYVPDVPVLTGVDLDIQPGETVALVGPTGAGKSTIVSLVQRFYEVTSGRITIDGYDIRSVSRHSIARQTGVVLQDPFLFSGTVKDNIRFSRPGASDAEVMAAAKAVGAHDIILRLSRGYDTEVSERGVNLSPGQRQLVSFARAILADPRILLLDEATASIDTQTEVIIQGAMKRLLAGRTSIVIAHRLSTVRDADRIVVLDHGRIVDIGSHQELVQRGGLYAHLYAMSYQEGVLQG